MHQPSDQKVVQAGTVRPVHPVTVARVVLRTVLLTRGTRQGPTVTLGRVGVWLLFDTVAWLLLLALTLLLLAPVVLLYQLLKRRSVWAGAWPLLRLLLELLVPLLAVELAVPHRPWLETLLPQRHYQLRLQRHVVKEVHVRHDLLITKQLQHKPGLTALHPPARSRKWRSRPASQWPVPFLVCLLLLAAGLLVALVDLLRRLLHRPVPQGVLWQPGSSD